jgi:peptidyl-dipeptidase Dcp
MTNPIFQTWQAPFGMPKFNDIHDHHYSEAFAQAFDEHASEVDKIANNPASPTFDNTIVAMETSGHQLTKTTDLFYNLAASDTNPARQEIEQAASIQWSAHNSFIYGHTGLFQRIKLIFDNLATLDLELDQRLLVKQVFSDFIRGGANLNAEGQLQIAAINQRLASLETQFGQNILAETNRFALILTQQTELSGLPEPVLRAAANEAGERGHPGKYAFSISRSSFTPFMQFADNRELRETLFNAYTQCASSDDTAGNTNIALEISSLRRQRAQILGFASHAHYMLEDRMAGNPDAVHRLLDEIWQPARKKAEQEAADLQALIHQQGENFDLEPWDWWYYTEKLRAARFKLNESEIKPYFELETVRDGAFMVANTLFGITFRPAPELPTYHPDVTCFEVNDSDGSLIGIFMTDYFMRPSKRGGAWMSQFRGQSNLASHVRPIVVNCCNFPKSSPCLLGLDEVTTLFHEFGHALHGLLSQVRYPSQAGTNVKRDFVELPSQIFEHWAMEPAVLRQYAKHVDSNEHIPEHLIEKILAASTFNQGFQTCEYLAAAYLDLAWHAATDSTSLTPDALERIEMARIGLPKTITARYKSTYFQHIFAGEHYSAGYYAYIWAEVLDADGFEAFKDNGIFDPATALSLRRNILERGGSGEPMALYESFRGRRPSVEALLANRGLAGV